MAELHFRGFPIRSEYYDERHGYETDDVFDSCDGTGDFLGWLYVEKYQD